jgi:hypothetical protein
MVFSVHMALLACAFAFAFLQPVIARPASELISVRDVWAPTVLEPHEGDVWTVGSKRTIIWYVAYTERLSVGFKWSLIIHLSRDPSQPPHQTSNSNGTLFLGYLDATSNEHLDVGMRYCMMIA